MAKSDLTKDIEECILKNREMHYRLAYSYVKNKEDALDIVQESIYKAITSIKTIKERDAINTWFCRIIINNSLDFLRERKKIIVGNEELLKTNNFGELDNYEDVDLSKALEELPGIYRNVIVLRYFEDFKIKEIAEVLDENINTIKSRLYKALEILKVQMED